MSDSTEGSTNQRHASTSSSAPFIVYIPDHVDKVALWMKASRMVEYMTPDDAIEIAEALITHANTLKNQEQ